MGVKNTKFHPDRPTFMLALWANFKGRRSNKKTPKNDRVGVIQVPGKVLARPFFSDIFFLLVRGHVELTSCKKSFVCVKALWSTGCKC